MCAQLHFNICKETGVQLDKKHWYEHILTGHGKTSPYLYRFGLIDNPMCPCEEEKQTVDHLIFKCKKIN